MGFNTNECEFKRVTIRVLGAKVKSLQGFSFKRTMDKELIYGSGGKPIDVAHGNESFEGSLSVLKYEYDLLHDAVVAAQLESLLHVPPNDVVITAEFKKTQTSPVRLITMTGVSFTEIDQAQSQGDKMTVIELPFIALNKIEGSL